MRRVHRQKPQHPVPDFHPWGEVAPPIRAPSHVVVNGGDVAPQDQEVADVGVIGFPAAIWVGSS